MILFRKKIRMTVLNKAYKLIIKWIKEQCSLNGVFSKLDEENFEGTDLRAAKAFAEMCRPQEEIIENCKKMLKSFSVDEGDVDAKMGMITQGPIYSNSLCPHHLLPVMFEVYVSYIPKKGKDAKVLGLSKLARLAQEVCKYPMLQETYAQLLADILFEGNENFEGVQSDGSAVMVIGQHGCMACRGVRSNALTISTEIRGCYEDNDLEQKFYKQVEAIRASALRRA